MPANEDRVDSALPLSDEEFVLVDAEGPDAFPPVALVLIKSMPLLPSLPE